MDYTILETHLTFENGVLKEVAVLAESRGDVLATISTKTPCAGYHYLKSYDIPTVTLFQEVAAYGKKLNQMEQKRYFPNHKI